MLKAALRVFSFINEKLLGNTKESTVSLAGLVTIGLANIRHNLRTKANQKLRLQYPNSVLQFPLPNRWSNPNVAHSKQPFHLVIKQVSLANKPAGSVERNRVNENYDRSFSNIHVIDVFKTIRESEIQMVERVRKEYNLLSDVVYKRERELLFADSLVNGQESYLLRKFNNDYYEIPASKNIHQRYNKALIDSLQNQTWNDNIKLYGLTKEQVIHRVTHNEGVYSMLFEHLQDISNGTVLKNQPQIYIDNQLVDQLLYLHAPYPVFLRVQGSKGETRFVCIGIGFRFNGQPKIFSPFFANQGERVWRLAQSHVGQAVINDFSVRVHLGIYHFTTNQYHVPVYNFLSSLKGDKANSFSGFLKHTYNLFSRGLEGVNVSATASLVHQVAKYSVVNRVFNFSQANAVTLIAKASNNVKIFEYDPINILKKQGLEKDEIKKYFDKLNFDIELYQILSKYIENVYQAFKVGEYEEQLLAEINLQTKSMAVGAGSTPRASLRNRQDVLKTIQNLAFCWVGFHSHTFSAVSFSNYFLFRPSMLKKQISANSHQWPGLQFGDQLPDTKMMMESVKLFQATTQRDSDNFLLDSIRRQAEDAAFSAQLYEKNPVEKEAFLKVEKAATETLQQLRAYEQRVLQKNSERKNQEGTVVFEWMVPSKIQTSLNI